MEREFFEQLRSEIKEVEEDSLRIAATKTSSGDFSFNYIDTLNRIELYWNSKYESGDTDSEGIRKWFYNISKYRSLVASKEIDLDTKDVQITTEEGQPYYYAWFFAKELKQWMKEKGFAKLINEVVYELPKYGSAVIKKIKGDCKMISLLNFYVEPSADTLDEALYVLEKHPYKFDELKETARKNKWDSNKVEELIEKARKKKQDRVTVWERYGLADGEWLKAEGLVYSRFITSDPEHEIILTEPEVFDKEDLPYKEVHYTKIRGRWLGIGVIEDCFEPQESRNELVNIKRKGLHWTAKKVYQTRDESINKNILADLKNGEIITASSEVLPIANEERNLSFFVQEEQSWDSLADRQTFTQDLVRGERPPSGTPLGTSILQGQQIAGFYGNIIRENLGIFLKDLLMEFIIPQFRTVFKKEHIINFMGSPEEMGKLDQLILNTKFNDKVVSWVLDKGEIPNQKTAQVLETVITAEMESDKSRYFTIPKSFYDNLKYKIDIIITDEEMDIGGKMQTLQVALQLLASNPLILKDPQLKSVFYKLLDLAGINPAEFEISASLPETQEAFTRALPQGGSIARPTPAAAPGVVPTEKKI